MSLVSWVSWIDSVFCFNEFILAQTWLYPIFSLRRAWDTEEEGGGENGGMGDGEGEKKGGGEGEMGGDGGLEGVEVEGKGKE